MLAPATPKNEEYRLASLYALRILDTAQEERFDRVTRLAKTLFNVPIALISLVDKDRLWIKSCIGLDTKEIPRDISFCGHTINHNEALIVEDLLTDSRFSDNPLVTAPPNLRFYAGHPITSPSGDNIGTLCVIDKQAKTLSQDDIIALADMASLVSTEIMSLQLASIDELTSITNRRGFKRLSQHCLEVAVRQKSICHLAYFDLNNFKLFNDNFGHIIGDKALQIFAKQMLNTFRVSDICARIGGDEFVVLLSDTRLETANQAIARFASNLRMVSKALGLPYQLSFSHGVATYDPQKHVNIEHLLDDADAAMYSNKRNANNN